MKTESLLERRAAAVPRGAFNIAPLFAEAASGSTVRDVDGREYLDFCGGIGVLNVGHCHPAVVAAIQAQAAKLVHMEDRLHEYIRWCIRNGLWEKPQAPSRRPNLRVITNDRAVQPNPRRMSSPMKTVAVREFESRVSRVFEIEALAIMEWPN